jgi:NAD(P)-dependent dehydrogenase (short-subunit alcohol dehydrogenase family)
MDLQLKGKRAIVTGGSAGIGLAIARLLAEEGVEVTIPGRHGKKLSKAVASLPGSVHGIEANLGTAEGAKKLIEQVPETDILVNNLGIYESKDFVDISDEDWLRYFEINLLGGIRLARHYFPAMLLISTLRFKSKKAKLTRVGKVEFRHGLSALSMGRSLPVFLFGRNFVDG